MRVMRVLSLQEQQVMRALKQGPLTLAQVQATLPASDERTELVRRASLSRSLRRLVGRGMITAANHTYAVRSLAANVPAKPASIGSLETKEPKLIELARQRLQRLGVRAANG